MTRFACAFSALTLFTGMALIPAALAETPPIEAPDRPSERVYGVLSLGNEAAPAKLVEYASVTCPACKAFHDEVMTDLKPLIEAGDLYFEFREMTTPPVPVATGGFLIVRCSGPDKAFDVINELFERQPEILTAARMGKAKPIILEIAASHGVSEDDYNACKKDVNITAAINASLDEAEQRDVFVTPTLFLNGDKLTTKEQRTSEWLTDRIADLVAAQAAELADNDEPVSQTGDE